MVSINYPHAKHYGGSPIIITGQCPRCSITLQIPAPFPAPSPPKTKCKGAVVQLSTNR